jgi:hypothetical protein
MGGPCSGTGAGERARTGDAGDGTGTSGAGRRGRSVSGST